MKRSLVVLLLLALAVTVTGCGSGGGGSVITDDQQINALLDQYESAMKSKDAERLAGMMAYPIELNGETYTSKEQVALMFTIAFGFMGDIHEFELCGRVWTINSSGTGAVVEAEAYSRITDIFGEIASDTSPATLQLRKVGNQWRIAGDGRV